MGEYRGPGKQDELRAGAEREQPGWDTDGLAQLLGPEIASKVKAVGLSEPGADAAVKERMLEAVLLGQPANDRTRETVLKQFDDASAQQQAVKDFSIKAADPELMAGALPGLSMAANPNRPRALVIDQEAATMAGLLLGSPEFQRR